MQEGKYKVLMYVFLVLFLISAGLAGYFWYKQNQLNRDLTTILYPDMEYLSDSEAIDEYNDKIASLSTDGYVLEIDNSQIIINSYGEERYFEFNENIIIEKLIPSDELDGSLVFTEANLEEIKEGMEVWIVFDESGKIANNIKLMSVNGE